MTSFITIRKRQIEYYLLTCIILLAIIVRVVYYLQVSKNPEYNSLILDPQFNDYWAKRIIHGPNYPSPTGEDPLIEKTPYGRPPAYPFILSFIYYLFGENLQTVRFLQTLIGLLNILLIYYLTSDLFHNRVSGLISGLMLATLWQTIYFEEEINYPTWVLTITLLLIWCFAKYVFSSKSIYTILSGTFLGILALFRPNALILYLLFTGLITYRYLSSKSQEMLKHLLILTIFVLFPLIPVFTRNYIVSNEFFLISCFGGVNTYIGNNPHSKGDSPTIPEINKLCGLDNWSCFNYRYLVAGLGIKNKGNAFTFSEASNFFYKKSIEFWKKYPLEALKLTARKFLLFWGPQIVSDGKVIQCEIEETVLRYLPRFQNLVALLLFSALCLIFKLYTPLNKNEFELSLFFPLYALFYSLSVIPFFISERYRVPIIPPLAIFSGGVIGSIITNEAILADTKKRYIIAILLVLCLIVSQIPFTSYSPDKSRYLYHKSLALLNHSKLEEAEKIILKAIEINPQNYEYQLLLGGIYLQTKKIPEAKICFMKALELNPFSATTHNNLGFIEELENNIDKAKELYRKATEINPVYTLAWINLGRMCLYYLNSPEEAKDYFLKAVEVDPNLWQTWFHLGNSYLTVGELAKAEESLRKSLILAPHNPHILNNIGLVYFQMGRLQESKEYFEKALSIDNNLIDAIFNLGRIYKKLSLPNEAKKYFEKVQFLQPNYPGLNEELQTLNY